MIDSEFEAEDFDAAWRPADFLEIIAEARAKVLNDIVMEAIRIVLPTQEQVDLYCDLMVPVPGLDMAVTPLGSEGELVNVSYRKYLIVRAVITHNVRLTGRTYAHTSIIKMRTILTNFV